MTTPKERALQAFSDWYSLLPVHKASGGPARGTIGAALVVLDHLKETYTLDLDAHRSGKSQIKGVSGNAVKRILAQHGEARRFLSEGGRTNRGAAGDIERMLTALRPLNLDQGDLPARVEVLGVLQGFLVEKVRAFHNRQRLKPVHDPSRNSRQSINDLLALARDTGKEGPVVQYLIGAKLQLRYPDMEIENASYSTADDQLGRPGDFHVGDTAFHVTVSPMEGVYEKCQRNLDNGFRVYLLVSDTTLVGARQIAESRNPGKIAVESIESFVSQNIEEISIFSKDGLVVGLRSLFEKYNERVDAIETDKSHLIEIPRTLIE